jgi:hypothetical protein
MRTRYRWDPEKNELVKIESQNAEFGTLIMPDLPDFVSPIDGKVVHGRKGLRDHEKRHNVTNVNDFKGQWEKAARERERYFTQGPQGRNVPHLISALQKGRK